MRRERDRRGKARRAGIQTPAQVFGASLLAWHRNGDWTASASLVSQWNDASGNARHVTAAGAQRPTETLAAFGALPGVTFTSSVTFLQETAAMLSGNAAHSIFAYVRPTLTATAGGYATIGTNPAGSLATSTVGKWSTNARWYAGDDDVGGLVASADVTPRLYSKTYDGTNYAPRRSGAADGAPFAAGGTLALSAGHSIGTYNGAASGVTDAVVGEVVVVSGVATASQIEATQAYFASVFGSI